MERSCYIVENISGRTIQISDLRAEIRPNKTLDLEKVARRIDIERSLDLLTALKQKLLKLVRNLKPEKIKIEKPLSEAELKKLVEIAMANAMQKSKETDTPLDMSRIQDSIKRQISHSINEQLDGKLDALLKAVQSIPQQTLISGSLVQANIGPEVDIAKLAEITQKGVESISADITQKDNEKKAKKIKLNTQASDLARELE